MLKVVCETNLEDTVRDIQNYLSIMDLRFSKSVFTKLFKQRIFKMLTSKVILYRL